MLDVERLTAAFHGACKEAGVRYAFVGGIAVIAWGQPRSTSDIDALLVAGPERFEAVEQAMEESGLSLSPGDLATAWSEGGHVTIHDPDSAFHIDVKIARSPPEIEEVDDAAEVTLHGIPLRIVGPEDTVAFKIQFGSPQDLADARAVWVRQRAKWDETRLRAALGRLGVSEAFDELVARWKHEEP